MSISELKKSWAEVTLIKIFEVQVQESGKSEPDWITFNIEESDTGLVAVPSEDLGVDIITVDWDDDFCLDQHLETLREYCSGALQESANWDENWDGWDD